MPVQNAFQVVIVDIPLQGLKARVAGNPQSVGVEIIPCFGDEFWKLGILSEAT
jgi:hypothetical protein